MKFEDTSFVGFFEERIGTSLEKIRHSSRPGVQIKRMPQCLLRGVTALTSAV